MVDGPDQWVVTHEIDPAKTTVLGRNDDCDLPLKGLGVSGRHAEIRNDGKRWLIRDLDSRNGTFVNSNKINTEQALRDGDTIAIKPFSLTWKDATALRPDMTLSGVSVDELLARRRRDSEKAMSTTALSGGMTGMLPRAGMKLPISASKLPTDGAIAQAETRVQNAERERDAQKALVARLTLKIELLSLAMFATNEAACYQEMLEACAKALKAEVGFLMLINPETKKWEVRAQTRNFEDLADDPAAQRGTAISLTLVTAAVKAKKTLLTSDIVQYGQQASASMVLNAIQTGIAAPILEGGEVVGCLYFDCREDPDRAFGPDGALDATTMAEAFGEATEFFVVRQALGAGAR